MLLGLHPLLTGEVLWRLDAMGHSDSLVIADANFPAHRLDPQAIDLPGASATEVVKAVCTVFPLDDPASVFLMATEDATARLPIHHELESVVGRPAQMLDRLAFYEAARKASLIIRTGEQRPYGNMLLRKGAQS